jgi:methylenetetrahydrofolate dehydrogenase (NADP+)/methenyltetrahydrofolate cyclohydrolase
MKSFETRLPATVSKEDLKTAITQMNQDPEVTAYLVQLPLPASFNTQEVMSWIDPKKDADGLTVESLGLLFAGRPHAIPCTPHGVMKILEHYDIDVEGKPAVVIGRSQIVGKPMAHLLTDANATVTLCHSRTKDLQQHTKQADIVVVAAGRPKFIGKQAFKKGAVVIDVGIHRMDNGKLCGDVDPAGLDDWVSALTPVPGGVGPMTITMLLQNTLTLYS